MFLFSAAQPGASDWTTTDYSECHHRHPPRVCGGDEGLLGGRPCRSTDVLGRGRKTCCLRPRLRRHVVLSYSDYVVPTPRSVCASLLVHDAIFRNNKSRAMRACVLKGKHTAVENRKCCDVFDVHSSYVRVRVVYSVHCSLNSMSPDQCALSPTSNVVVKYTS